MHAIKYVDYVLLCICNTKYTIISLGKSKTKIEGPRVDMYVGSTIPEKLPDIPFLRELKEVWQLRRTETEDKSFGPIISVQQDTIHEAISTVVPLGSLYTSLKAMKAFFTLHSIARELRTVHTAKLSHSRVTIIGRR